MNIGIIGAGNIGGTLARKFSALGHRVAVSNSRGPATLAAFAAGTGMEPVDIGQVVRDKDVIVIAIPEEGILRLPKGLFSGAATGTIVVDTGNYYPEVRDRTIPAIEEGMPESQWVAEQLQVPIVKAFNAITVGSLTTRGLPPGAPGRIALPVAGNNARDKEVIFELIHHLGFDALDAGMLAGSWRQQPGAPAYCMDLGAHALTTALGKAEHSRIGEYRRNAVAGAKRAVEAAGSLAAAMAGAGRPANS
ncbi:MAG TPA: NAD(P)-binding domain-containing protein [Puia sp.]|nr:NAD(P)-binding domain-containing protein [Puia sp.]